MPQLIGINGLKTSGKDTTYEILTRLYNDGDAFVQRAAFADKLKRAAAAALGFDRSPQEAIELMDRCKELWTINITEPLIHDGDTLGYNGQPKPQVSWPTWHTLTGREYLQNFGGRMRELFGDSFWVDQVLPRPYDDEGSVNDIVADRGMKAYYPDADCVVVTDVRYPNEAQRVKELGGVVWEVLRPGLVSDGHATEKPLPPSLVDYKIVNDGDLDVLEGRVLTALETLP